ncbi:hypothetical protein B0A53_04294 [Rhodotorula sp. CCFEE 5036]|nr:hypothetical protein B0A53_04294 [Rhodotorula sp. CCFEE 5036]
MATSARAETALAELSFNLQPVTSPRLHQDAPERTCTPQGKVVQSVATPQRTGESPLAPKDLNSPGAGLLLIDVEPSLSRECTPKGLLQPRTPSAFARSLLDRTPGMFKAQLGTPLIPLGTPVTSRKRPQRTPASTPAAAKENGTPAAVRRSARLASPCASPQSPRASPAVPPTTLSASPSLGGLRFSTTPRKGRSTPRKNATPAKPTEPTAVSFTLNGTATDVSPVQPASKTSRGPAVTPSRGSLAATSLRHSPFPAFSPSTPLIRTHDSYSDTELTDCDADGSIWEDDFEDPSFSYLSGSNETPVVDAFARLRVDDVPDASTLCSQDPPTVAHEDSVQLTATEVESASGSEAEDDDDSLELGTIAEEDDDDEVALDDSSSTSTSDVACDQSMPEAAPAETAAEELPSVEDAMAPPNEVAAAAFEGGMDGDDAAAIVEERVVSLNEIAADTTEARSTSDSPGAESALATPDVTETTEQPVVANEAPTAPPQETVPSSAPAVSLSPSSSTQEAVEPDAEVALAGPVAEDDDDRHDLEPIRADTADEPVPSSTTVEASVSTSDTVEETAEKLDAGRSASPSAELDDEPACPTSPNRSEPPTPPTEQTTPLRVSNVPETTTPAATPPRRPLTATVPTAQQPLGKAAPTARRQLTKLTEVRGTRKGRPCVVSARPKRYDYSGDTRAQFDGASAKPSLSKTASVAAAPGVESLTGKAPRAALAGYASKRNGGRIGDSRSGSAPETRSISRTGGHRRSPDFLDHNVGRCSAADPTQASPLRSPRRVPLSQQMQPGIVAPSANTSILVAPAQTVAAAAPAVFGSSTRAAAPPKMTRTTRRTAQPDTSAAAPVAAVPLAVGRPVRAAAMNATYSGTAAPGPPPGGRMARKITRRQQPTDAEETASAESTSVTATRPESAASSETTEETETGVPAPARALPIFRPAPVLTQVELNRLTQRNTKKNQQTFNQFKLETVFLDYDRPPSPTSKIRKSSSLANAASKEGREARAAKRRNALRASVDGSELEALSLELSAEDIDTTPEEHYRAPGDEEPYSTPSRTTAVVKCAKGGSRAAGSKKRTSTEAALDSEDGGKAARRVRWDRSLVYEGPREGYAKPPDASIIVIKSTDIDAWGNPTAPPRDLGKAVPVTIRMRVFKNDEK